MTPPEYVKAAKQAIAEVKTDRALQAWHDQWAHGESYVCLPDNAAVEIEAIYAAAVRRVWGVEA